MEDKTCIKENMVFNFSGQFIGNIAIDEFYTTRKPMHFMRKFSGFGVSLNVLNLLKEHGVRYVIINYIGALKSVQYMATVQKFILSDKEYTFISKDIMDKQKFLSVKDMAEI